MPDAAFLGLGLMGAPIARRLLAAGHDVALWNRSAAKARAVGPDVRETAAAAVAGAPVVFLCLTDGDAIEDVLFGRGAAAEAIEAGAVVVDFSTSAPARVIGLADRLGASRGAGWLDCPVSGGVAGAEAGTLIVMAGGDEARLDRVRPMLAAVAARVTRMGDVGAGQAAKLCNQLIVSTNLIAIAEAIALGRALGIDTGALPAALAGGFADSTPLQLFGPRMAGPDHGPVVAELKTMAKDARAVFDAAERAGAPALPLNERVRALYDTLLDRGLGAEDFPTIMRLYQTAAGQRP